MPRIIAICNQKGGVGKTTCVINVGAALASMGKRVLLVDIDPQANCTSGVGVDPTALPLTLYDVLVQPNKFKIFRMEDVITSTRWENLDLVPGHPDLASAELHLVRKIGRESLLRKNLEPVCRPYEFILIDTPPSLSLLTVNALTAADEVIIASRAEPWSLDGIENLLDTIDAIREEINPDLEATGIIVTVLHERAKLSHEILRRVEADPRLHGKLFRTRLRRNIKLVESADRGIPAVYCAPESHGSRAFKALAREICGLDLETERPADPEPGDGETTGHFDLVPVQNVSNLPQVREPAETESVEETEALARLARDVLGI